MLSGIFFTLILHFCSLRFIPQTFSSQIPLSSPETTFGTCAAIQPTPFLHTKTTFWYCFTPIRLVASSQLRDVVGQKGSATDTVEPPVLTTPSLRCVKPPASGGGYRCVRNSRKRRVCGRTLLSRNVPRCFRILHNTYPHCTCPASKCPHKKCNYSSPLSNRSSVSKSIHREQFSWF